MEGNKYQSYKLAELKDDELNNITELEKAISSKVQKDVVLIAYESSEKAK
ncbi:hypothetical protein [Anaeromicropila herbilytica]|uniref:Uncharacterized protein n=1 Tax=Anaeromicropila herbilytica TaxID=2785025 RepID=A0A7R7ICP2_9FIRM|nr:hypothetical protein [Anaeromicropila herbilytica]BCN30727.1 hypothetical protein bsdtb5_20220 [Anaeromicropila herbilytica]